MKNKINPVLKIFLAMPGGRGEPFCGPGMISLLEHIAETSNVRMACEKMDMSYSKGWKLLKALESYMECPATLRRQGGNGGGDSHLTEEGAKFLKRYRDFESECNRSMNKIFTKHYGA
ncbi:MAG: hypothetical protein Ta2B_26900 [Termitinemataceae bacterium]|nr:MAG: hypothetical protein Ta2B_26900 [Termitinemataceae bacterium]